MSFTDAVITPARGDLRGLLRGGGWGALASVALIVVQVVVFTIWPPVHTVAEVFALMAQNPVLGLLSLAVLYIANNLLVWLFYRDLELPSSRSPGRGWFSPWGWAPYRWPPIWPPIRPPRY